MMNHKIPNYIKDKRAKFFYKHILSLMPEYKERDQLIIAQLAGAMSNCEKAQDELNKNGLILETATAIKANPYAAFLTSQQLAVRHGLQQLRLTPQSIEKHPAFAAEINNQKTKSEKEKEKELNDTYFS